QGSRQTDNNITSGIRNQFGSSLNDTPAVGTITGILTDPQFRVVIHALEQRGGADLLAAPRVTTMSGRQAQVQLTDLKSVVTGLDQQQQGAGGGGPDGGAPLPGGQAAIGSTVNYN